MSDHYMQVVLEDGYPKLVPGCRAEYGAPCRLICNSGCEDWEMPTKLSDGWWHTARDGVPHKMHDLGRCIVVWGLEDCAEELCSSTKEIKIAEFDITPECTYDGYEWAPAQP